jgi:hypothetical protein
LGNFFSLILLEEVVLFLKQKRKTTYDMLSQFQDPETKRKYHRPNLYSRLSFYLSACFLIWNFYCSYLFTSLSFFFLVVLGSNTSAIPLSYTLATYFSPFNSLKYSRKYIFLLFFLRLYQISYLTSPLFLCWMAGGIFLMKNFFYFNVVS